MTAQRPRYPSYGSTDPVEVIVVDHNPIAFQEYEFSALAEKITSSIYRIEGNASGLERAQKAIGTEGDNTNLRDRMSSIQQNTNMLIGLTTQQVKSLSSLSRSGQRKHKLQSERLRNEFQETIQRYGNLQKQVADKIKMVLLRPTPRQARALSSATEWGSNEESSDATQLYDEEATRLQQQRQLEMDLEVERGLAIEREGKIMQLEADMLDVNEIMRDLASLVVEQGEQIATIDSNITRVSDRVEGGVEQLQAAQSYQKKYRSKLCWLLLILLIVAIVVIILVVVLNKG